MPLRHRVSSLQLDTDDRIIDVVDVDHPFVRYRLHRVPTMALWYTLFIKVPTIEGIQTTLNAMGLLSALVLTICAVLPFAYSHDDYQQAIERWNSTTWISTDGKTLYLPDDPRRATLPYADKYRSFHERWATAFTMLSISLVLVVVLSAAISQASFREPHTRKVEPAAVVRWWAFMRWVLMYSFVTLVIGILQTCLTINSQLLLFLPRAPGPYPLGYGPMDMLTGQNVGVDDPNTSYSTNVRATTHHPRRLGSQPWRLTLVRAAVFACLPGPALRGHLAHGLRLPRAHRQRVGGVRAAISTRFARRRGQAEACSRPKRLDIMTFSMGIYLCCILRAHVVFTSEYLAAHSKTRDSKIEVPLGRAQGVRPGRLRQPEKRLHSQKNTVISGSEDLTVC